MCPSGPFIIFPKKFVLKNMIPRHQGLATRKPKEDELVNILKQWHTTAD